MNPPSALQGAMGRDRKPFTYTPGGLDLSEIKSERMAKRLMRNAMNEGVPQQPVQLVQSPPASTIAVPNFNCLPVQVFPAFNLPANPKSLLRTRSNPVSREPPPQRVGPQFVNNKVPIQYDTFSKNTLPYSQINNNRPTSMFEYGAGTTPFVDAYNTICSKQDSYNADFPEISYDAQYFQTPKINNYVEKAAPPITINNDVAMDLRGDNDVLFKVKETLFEPMSDLASDNTQPKSSELYAPSAYVNKESVIDIKPEIVTPVPEVIVIPESQIQEDVGHSDEQKEERIAINEVKKETKTEEQNGDQNGDTDAVMTVKLPTKKSSAKTETKVEISKKTLPDGSIEEVKKTITKTTIDGKTETKTKTETTIIPKDDEEEEEVEDEEDENAEGVVTEVDEQVEEKPLATVIKTAEESSIQIRENGQDNIIKSEERSETTTTSTKKVVIVQDDGNDEQEDEEVVLEEEEEKVEETVPVTVVLKKPSEQSPSQKQVEEEEETQVEEHEETEVKEAEKTKEVIVVSDEEEEEEITVPKQAVPTAVKEEKEVAEEEEMVEEEEEYEEANEEEVEVQVIKEPEVLKEEQRGDDDLKNTDEVIEPEEAKLTEKPNEETKAPVGENETPAKEPEISVETPEAPIEVQIPIQKEFDDKQEVIVENQEEIKHEVTEETKSEKLRTLIESRVPLREPSVPLEKVEDVEIKPIGAGNFVTKTHTETTEIITGSGDKPTGLLTEYNRTENIVTVNRTTKTLDYETAPQTIPTLTYFTPHIEKFPPSPQPINKPYQPVYPSEPTSERRHSLLLERLSIERQIPTNEIYQNTQQYNQTLEQQNQWSEEPRVEILTIENVKPSSITNQQWYQQTDKKDIIYNNVAPVAPPVAPSWTQPKPQQQPAYQSPSQPTYQPPQPAYQPQPKPAYQAQQQPKPVYQPPQPHPVYQSQPQYHSRPITQSQTQPQYQSSYTENLQHNTSSQQSTYTNQNYSTYTPKPTNWDTPRIDEPSQYSSDSYQIPQQRTASYVPPPWEQDSTYVVDNSQNYYQPLPQSTFTPDINQDWKPAQPAPKFTKTTPTAYIPPKPNQSFVKHVTVAEPPKQPGRKTYYSEYERRYISVPESTYIPGDTKLASQQSQPQPDPSPAYYYDNNEPAETVEHEWRKELREFTEKAQTQPENVKPPWQSSIESKTQTQYAKTQETTYTATPTWSQTLRPQSWRERSFESEFVSNEWPKTNTLGRGRPLSSYGRQSSAVPERTRGVSVDRYNPNNYQAPVSEPHPPVQTFTHNPPAPHATGYHNPNVPAYHASRASAEPREQPAYQQPRARVDSRASPFQSRSFKYLQWITGTED